MEFSNIKLPLVAVDLTETAGKAIVLDGSEQMKPVADVQNFGDAKEEAALANIFAAAPELLEALEMALPYLKELETRYFIDDSIALEKFPLIAKTCNMAKSAIAKAYGKTKD